MDRIVVTGGPCQRGQEFELTGEVQSIGLNDGRIEVCDGTVAADMLLVRRRGGYVFCGSSPTGATINREGAGQREIRDGDELRIGPFRLLFQSDEGGSPPPGPRAIGFDWLRAILCSVGVLLIALLLWKSGPSGDLGGESGIAEATTGVGTGLGAVEGSGIGTGAADSGAGADAADAAAAEVSSEVAHETAMASEAAEEEDETGEKTEDVVKVAPDAPSLPSEIRVATLTPVKPASPPVPSPSQAGLPGAAMAKPKRAITKGSFSVWTVPENPAPRQNYVVFIQLNVPSHAKTYDMSDLSGSIIGTDGFEHHVSYAKGHRIQVQDGIVQISVPIPGAKRLVRDEIRVKSEFLKEQQKIDIVFQ